MLYGQTINLEFLGIDRIYPFEQLQVSIEKYPEHGELLNFSANEYGGSILTSYLGSYIATSNTNVLDSIVFNVYNDTKSITGVCYINIEAVKMAPRLASIASQKINEASSLEIELQVTDEDTKAEMLHWNISTVPDIDVAFEVKIENDVPVATYTPPPTFYGNVLIKTTVSDSDNLSDTKMFTLNIENTNDKPVIHFEDSITAFEDSTFSYTLKAEDFDKDSLMFSFSGLPQWLSFRVLSKYMVEIFGTPLQSDVGNNNITVAISDNKESIEEALILEVIETNDPLYQQTQIDTIFAKAGGDAVSLVLNDFFADDDPNANLDFDILENSNAAVATSTINNGILEIGFDNTELGTTNIVLEVSSQGDTLNTTIVVIVDSKVGIMDFDQNIEFAVYPNPIADKFTVKFSDGNSKWSVQALNLSGQIIFHKNIVERNEIILNATIFPSQGTYLIRAFSDETIKTQKVVIY